MYLFFLGLVFFWVKEWGQFLEACGGAAEVRCSSRERKRNKKEKNRLHLFSVAANCWASLTTQQHFFFGFANFNKSYGAIPASKVKTRPGFVEVLQSLPVFARFTC